MRTTVQLLSATCLLLLVACGSDSSTAGSAEAGLVESFPAVRGACGPESKVDEEGDQQDLCDGAPATEICVKAGTMCFCAEQSETYQDCYDFDLESGSVSRIGNGRYCKGISHTEYNCGPGEPPCECEDDEDCISPKSGGGGNLICVDCQCVPRPCECETDEHCISPKSGGGGEQVCRDCYCVWL